MNRNEEKAIQAANELLSFVNSFSCDTKTFAKTISRGHKTLQQSVMRLFMETIREMAQVLPDDRNLATVTLSKKIMELAKDHPLPMI